MKRSLLAVTLGLSAFAVGWYIVTPAAEPAASLAHLTGDVARGAYLARAGGCIVCHTDIAGGGAPLAGGPALATPFGTFYGPNLTTDKTYGIGNWSVDDFATALRLGQRPDGDHYYPAFPYTFYTGLTDQDVADLWAAFRTVRPAAVASIPHDLKFPFNLREGLLLWQGLFFEAAPFTPVPDQGAEFNRGAYLTESVAHCGACHSPRSLLGALELDAPFSGSVSWTEEDSRVPSITAEALKEKGWTLEDLAYALKTGIKHDGDVFGGSMGEVVRDGTSFMRPDDLRAIAYYLLNRDIKKPSE